MSSKIDKELLKNGSGYVDPTAYEAIVNTSKTKDSGRRKGRKKGAEKTADADERAQKFLKIIFELAEISGFHVEGRVVFRDVKTGKLYD